MNLWHRRPNKSATSTIHHSRLKTHLSDKSLQRRLLTSTYRNVFTDSGQLSVQLCCLSVQPNFAHFIIFVTVLHVCFYALNKQNKVKVLEGFFFGFLTFLLFFVLVFFFISFPFWRCMFDQNGYQSVLSARVSYCISKTQTMNTTSPACHQPSFRSKSTDVTHMTLHAKSLIWQTENAGKSTGNMENASNWICCRPNGKCMTKWHFHLQQLVWLSLLLHLLSSNNLMTLATPVLTAILISYCTQQRSAVASKPAASHVNFNVTTAVIVILQFCDNKLMTMPITYYNIKYWQVLGCKGNM